MFILLVCFPRTVRINWYIREETLQRSPASVQARIRHGPEVEEILAEARDGNYDLIIVGTHQTRGWQRFLLDNLAHQIVVQADRPVLIV